MVYYYRTAERSGDWYGTWRGFIAIVRYVRAWVYFVVMGMDFRIGFRVALACLACSSMTPEKSRQAINRESR